MQRHTPTEQHYSQHAPQTTADQIAIVNSTDNQASLQTIMDNPENTMTEEASISVGSVLIRLAKRYLEFHVDAQDQMHLNENKLNQYLADLKQKIETHISKHEIKLALQKEKIEKAKENEAPTHSSQISSSDSANQSKKKKIDYGFLKSAWAYMQARMKEEPNQLDQVTFFEGDQAFTVIIDIKTTLALVYAAITDTDIFKPDAKDFKKNQQERFFTLFMSFNRLQFDSKQRCHQGVRHDLVICNLSGTYPDAIIVSEPKNFLADLISEAIFKLVEKIKTESGQPIYLDVIKECIMGEVHPELKKKLGDKSELRKAIHQAFRYVGLDPLNTKYEIEKYIRALNVVVTLPEGLIALGNQVHILLEASTKQTNELESRTQFIEFMKTHWLKMQFSLANSEHQDTIQHLSQVETAYALCLQYGRLFKSSKVNPLLSAEEFNSIYKQIDEYYQMCLSKQAPIKTTETFLSQLDKLKPALKLLEKDMEWTCNIFARWKAAMDRCQEDQSDDALNDLIRLHQEIIDVDIQSHYLVNDVLLKELFKPKNENEENQFELFENELGFVLKNTQTQEIDLDYFNVNRLFLTAIATAPKEWTPLFFEKLNDTILFIEGKKYVDDPDVQVTQNSRQFIFSSYPDNLLCHLNVSILEYKKIHRPELNRTASNLYSDERYYIPFLHQINNFQSALNYFILLSERSHDEFFEYLKIHDICQHDDTDEYGKMNRTYFIVDMVHEKKTKISMKLLLNIHPGYMRTFLELSSKSIFDRLIKLLKSDQNQQFQILNHLGAEYVKELLAKENFSIWAGSLFTAFSTESRTDLLNFCGIDFIKEITPHNKISDLIALFPENQKLEILKLFGVEFLKEFYSKSDFLEISNLFKAFNDKSLELFNYLGSDFIKSINSPSKLFSALDFFPKDQRLNILKNFDINLLKKDLFGHGYFNISSLFNRLDASLRNDLFNHLGIAFIKENVYPLELPELIKLFPENQRIETLKQFDKAFLKNLFSNSQTEAFIELFYALNEESRIEAIKNIFDIDFIKEWILKNGINYFTDIIPDDEKNLFFKILGSNFLKNYFLKSNDLSLIHFVKESERFHLFLMLGFDTVRQWIWGNREYNVLELVKSLPSEEREHFLHELGFKFLRSLIANKLKYLTISHLLNQLSSKTRLNFLYELGLPFLREQLSRNSIHHLIGLLQALSLEESLTFLKWLDSDLLKQVAKNHPKGVMAWIQEINPSLTEKQTKEILILLGKDFLESQIKTSKDIEFLSKFIKVRDTSSISTTYFGLFNRSHVKTPSFALQEALFGAEFPTFPQPLSNPFNFVPENHVVCGGWKYWIKLMDTWNDDEIQNQDQYQWFATYGHSVLAGLILIRYANGDYGLMLGAREGCEERLSKALREKHMSAEEKYLQHFKEWKLNPPFYINKGSLHEIREELSDIFDVITRLEGDYPANQFILYISTQLDHIKTPPPGFSLN